MGDFLCLMLIFAVMYFPGWIFLIRLLFVSLLREPELFHIKFRVPKYFGIPVVLIDITGIINRGYVRK